MPRNEQLARVIAKAVAEGVEARSAFYTAMAEPDRQELGSPATEEQLNAVARILGAPLPPTYEAFLRLHNGWKMFDAATDLYSADEIARASASKGLQKWRRIAIEVEGVDAANWLIIGGSREAATKYFIDPGRESTDGEFLVIEHDKVVESEYPSFLDLLYESTSVYREGLKDIDGGFDFSKV